MIFNSNKPLSKYIKDKFPIIAGPCVIENEKYGGVYDKLQMFNLYKDGQNIYFDLDVLIKGDCNKFL